MMGGNTVQEVKDFGERRSHDAAFLMVIGAEPLTLDECAELDAMFEPGAVGSDYRYRQLATRALLYGRADVTVNEFYGLAKVDLMGETE